MLPPRTIPLEQVFLFGESIAGAGYWWRKSAHGAVQGPEGISITSPGLNFCTLIIALLFFFSSFCLFHAPYAMVRHGHIAAMYERGERTNTQTRPAPPENFCFPTCQRKIQEDNLVTPLQLNGLTRWTRYQKSPLRYQTRCPERKKSFEEVGEKPRSRSGQRRALRLGRSLLLLDALSTLPSCVCDCAACHCQRQTPPRRPSEASPGPLFSARKKGGAWETIKRGKYQSWSLLVH